MTINDRISILITVLNSNPNYFAETLGVKSPIIYNIIKGRRSKPSYDVLQKILTIYSSVNANWLLNGDGEIWKSEVENPIDNTETYEVVGDRISNLVSTLRNQLGDDPGLEELTELVKILLKENVSQKGKIAALYEKHERIILMLNEKLGLDIRL